MLEIIIIIIGIVIAYFTFGLIYAVIIAICDAEYHASREYHEHKKWRNQQPW